MFKAAFPWSTAQEELAERKFHKTLPSAAGEEEVAGNVWIAPEDGMYTFGLQFALPSCAKPADRKTVALDLATEYTIRPWIVALLDPEPIEKGSKEKHPGAIATPPKFIVSEADKLFPPPSAKRGGSKRSASPSKASPRKIASPKKRSARAASAKAEAKPEDDAESAKKASKVLQEKLTNGTPAVTESAPAITGTDDIVRITTQEIVEKDANLETTKTSVTIDVPASHPDLPIPESMDKIIAEAKEMVAEANKLEKTKSRASKRKASSSLQPEAAAESGDSSREPKRARTALADTLANERVKNRALIGLSAALAIGYVHLSY